MMRVEALLFGADGVIQKRPPAWKTSLGDVFGFTGDPEKFLADIFAVEQPALDGNAARFSLNEDRDIFYQILVDSGLPVAKRE